MQQAPVRWWLYPTSAPHSYTVAVVIESRRIISDYLKGTQTHRVVNLAITQPQTTVSDRTIVNLLTTVTNIKPIFTKIENSAYISQARRLYVNLQQIYWNNLNYIWFNLIKLSETQ